MAASRFMYSFRAVRFLKFMRCPLIVAEHFSSAGGAFLVPHWRVVPLQCGTVVLLSVAIVGDHAVRPGRRCELVFELAQGHRVGNEAIVVGSDQKLAMVAEVIWIHGTGLLLPVRGVARGDGISASAVYVVEASIVAGAGSVRSESWRDVPQTYSLRADPNLTG